MTLRTRLTLVVGITAAVAIITAIFGASLVTNRELVRTVDRSLLNAQLRPGLGRDGAAGPPQIPLGVLFQAIDQNGTARSTPRSTPLPIDDRERTVAVEGKRAVFRTIVIDGERFRLVTRPTADGAVQLARSLAEAQATTQRVRSRMMFLGLLGVAVSALAAWLIGSREAKPIQDLTAAAEEVAETQNLSTVIPDSGSSEVGRLSRSISSMLTALDASRRQQQRLIQDASHELRTPLTSMRANTDLLRRFDELPIADRTSLIDDLQQESEELSSLVGELVDLATDHRLSEAPQMVDVKELAESVARRFARRSGRTISVAPATGLTGDGTTVPVRRSQLERALSNLVENAIKFSPAETAIEVGVGSRHVSVRDHGPGIPEADLPRIFDRFYRADATRTMPGSGLGLAIVQQFATDHGGRATAANHPAGGAIVGFSW